MIQRTCPRCHAPLRPMSTGSRGCTSCAALYREPVQRRRIVDDLRGQLRLLFPDAHAGEGAK